MEGICIKIIIFTAFIKLCIFIKFASHTLSKLKKPKELILIGYSFTIITHFKLFGQNPTRAGGHAILKFIFVQQLYLTLYG